MYDSKKSSFVDISMLDVLQIFGRAGRPQYDKVNFFISVLNCRVLRYQTDNKFGYVRILFF